MGDCKRHAPDYRSNKVNQVEEAAKAARIELTADEISRLERLGNETGVHTLREWEKEM